MERWFSAANPQNHLRLLTLCAIASRAVTVSLLWLNDPISPLTSSLLRWDAFHFAQIAKEGYVYEQQWAFLPEGPPGWIDILQGGGLAALVCDSTLTLYRLSLLHLQSPSLALIASLLSLLPSSPAILHFAGYSEPFFTFLSYKGMLSCARQQWFSAACYFMLASIFRSNGILLGGFLLYGLIVQSFLRGKIPSRFAPFIFHQYTAYYIFCNPCEPNVIPPSWCTKKIPSIYTHVQSHYWNVGFLRYWTISQSPNILLASPVLALLFTFSITHLINAVPPLFHASKLGVIVPSSPFFTESLIPHAIHAIVLSSALLFASHTQIALRLAASMPITYWAAAWLITERPWWGRMWIAWSVVWGAAISVVLWAVFLPPA
ncbi:hypothetical protein EW146_g7639 [Bondarzewia mesenterica]|uniref:GPI mannosyltransferase 2 n=1 Tax=Bondarzewia mesenterica TaxID=1095465 RepID=A0A4S4LM03_9AGAM|nr:hypothetical protein EW146_g7639 [Bondarzewia mesenterica]